MNIPAKGDVVVGQEYTDFNKGLDDGIEGDIYGFNLLLTSASKSTKSTRYTKSPEGYSNPEATYYKTDDVLQEDETKETPKIEKEVVPSILGYFPYHANRVAKGFFSFGGQILRNMFSFFDTSPSIKVRTLDYPKKPHNYHQVYNENLDQIYSPNARINNYNTKRILNEVHVPNNDIASSRPLGTILIELSFNNCALGKGSPVVDKKVIVSWTKTPVRVFGGAMWKPITPFCKVNKFI